MSKKTVGMCGLICVVTLVIHYFISSQQQISILRDALRIEANQSSDLMYQLRDLSNRQSFLESQGYIAGILDAMDRPDHYDAVWHAGYDQGQEVRKELVKVMKEKEKEGVIMTKFKNK